MIGQKILKQEIRDLIEHGRFPRFSIIVGERGSEFKYVPRYIVGIFLSVYNEQEFADTVILPDNKVGTIRDYIDLSYKQTVPIIYVIPDADNMSVQAINALLKVTEEPPNSAYFMMFAENESNLLETIRSRAYIFRMNRYTSGELSEYVYERYNLNPGIEVDVCSTPGEVDILFRSRVVNDTTLIEYAYKFSEDVMLISGAKAFTLTDSVSTKDGDGKFDIALFLKFVQYHWLCAANKSNDTERISKYCRSIIEAGFALKDLPIRGINKKMLLDNFVLNVRRVWK